jgi:hypothetical protein
MRRSVAWLLSAVGFLFSFGLGAGAVLRPPDSGAPLFRVFAAAPMKGSDEHRITFDEKKPLLVISALADIRLGRDKKSVLITLVGADARRFADLTRKYNHDLLVLEANGRVLEAMQVSDPVVNGVLEFKHPGDADVAQYLRKRFRLGEFK